MSTSPRSSHAALLAVTLLFSGVLVACGGGGGDAPAPAPGPVDPPVQPPAATTRWISTAAQIDLAGGADSGIEGPLLAVDPARPGMPATQAPSLVDSTSVRIMGGKLDATLSTLTGPGPRFVVYDAAVQPASSFGYSLYKLDLDAVGTAAPVAERISNETTVCGAAGARFTVIGQSLAGDDALITYQAPDAGGSCASGGVPRLVKLGMGRNAAPIALPTGAADRITPIGVIHGSNGQVAAVLAWQNGRLVRTDASLGSPVAVPAADITGTLDAEAAPTAAGIVTRFGIFIRSADGLRRYDKSTGKVSALLVAGEVGTGAQINSFQDDQALYITKRNAGGTLDLHRVTDSLTPTATLLNTEGPMHPWGFRVLKSSVLYAVDGRDDFMAWRKSDGQRSRVLADKRVVLASSRHDRVFHSTTDNMGNTVLASSELDGSGERSLGAGQLASGALPASLAPFDRSVRGQGAFDHAVVAVPMAGKTGLAGAALRWVSFETAAQDFEAGSLPATLLLGSTLEAPGIVGDAGLFSIPKTGTGDAYLFASRRAAGSLVRVANGVQ